MSAPRGPLRPISWRWAAAGAGAVALAISVSVWLLLAQTHGLSGAEQTTARMDAIKTGLSIGAGTGGAVALLLAWRRQWLGEREQAHREQVDERVATATEYDAAERRVTELYVKAADQLGSDKAPVRLAGLYALERLAQDNAAHRTTVVNLVCAYLRMPYTAPEQTPRPAAQGTGAREGRERAGRGEQLHARQQELQVRKTAQRILADHLRDGHHPRQHERGPAPHSFWEIESIDLSGAHLVDFHLADARVAVVDFNNATFTGEAVFRGLHCDLAFIQGARFTGHTDFRGAEFTAAAYFSGTAFDSDVWFHADEFYPGAHFGGHAGFRGAVFARDARFNQTAFEASAEFQGAGYPGGHAAVDLEGARVADPDALSPEVTKAPSTWPPGWAVQRGPDNTGTLTRVSPTPTAPPNSVGA